jgi:hypothetical protein
LKKVILKKGLSARMLRSPVVNIARDERRRRTWKEKVELKDCDVGASIIYCFIKE